MALRAWLRALRPGGQLVLIEGFTPRPAGGQAQGLMQTDYAPIRDALPLFGGRPAEEIAELARGAGFDDISVKPLVDAVLWGEETERQRYALCARRPA